jgi:hypothetical protein
MAPCAPIIVVDFWPRIGMRDTAEKQTKLQEQGALDF